MKTYAEKLKDPRWQRKRLEVLNHSGWMCEICGDTTQTLHVHHLGYEPGKEPWEHEHLVCLCEEHHRFCHGLPNRNQEKSGTIEGVRHSEVERKKSGVPYIDPLRFIVQVDASRGNPDAIALLELWRKSA